MKRAATRGTSFCAASEAPAEQKLKAAKVLVVGVGARSPVIAIWVLPASAPSASSTTTRSGSATSSAR